MSRRYALIGIWRSRQVGNDEGSQRHSLPVHARVASRINLQVEIGRVLNRLVGLGYAEQITHRLYLDERLMPAVQTEVGQFHLQSEEYGDSAQLR